MKKTSTSSTKKFRSTFSRVRNSIQNTTVRIIRTYPRHSTGVLGQEPPEAAYAYLPSVRLLEAVQGPSRPGRETCGGTRRKPSGGLKTPHRRRWLPKRAARRGSRPATPFPDPFIYKPMFGGEDGIRLLNARPDPAVCRRISRNRRPERHDPATSSWKALRSRIRPLTFRECKHTSKPVKALVAALKRRMDAVGFPVFVSYENIP